MNTLDRKSWIDSRPWIDLESSYVKSNLARVSEELDFDLERKFIEWRHRGVVIFEDFADMAHIEALKSRHRLPSDTSRGCMNRSLVNYAWFLLRLAWYLPGSMRRHWRYRAARARWRERKVELSSIFSGEAEPRICRTVLQNPHALAIMRDFRWYEYMRANPDLHFATHEDARRHFVYTGYTERRQFDLDRCMGLDTDYYLKRYPELNLNGNAAAQVHYSYEGYYEDRFANAGTEWLWNTSLHVFQFGNVGSHSIAAALNGNYEGGVLHLHWPTDLAVNYPYCSVSYKNIVNHNRDKPLLIVSASREVVSRVISGSFQYLSTLGLHSYDAMTIDKVNTYLNDSFMNSCDIIMSWFDHQFYCGLDIYANRFDQRLGCTRIRNSAAELFLYRAENLSSLEGELAEFLSLPNFKLSRKNASDEKSFSAVYQYIMMNYTVPRHILEKLYETQYMKFFYSEKERFRFMEYWLSPRTQYSRFMLE